jgi:toxin FitB
MAYLLDTNVISEIHKREPDPHVLQWYDSVPGSQLFLSVLTVGEIRMGIERLGQKDQVRAEALERWLGRLQASYSDHVVGIDIDTAAEWGRMNVPDPPPVVDGLLAATARIPGLDAGDAQYR